MITARQVIELAKNGELKTLAVKDDLQAVLGFINLGLIELYKRFPIEVNEFIIPIEEGKFIYELPNDFMWAVEAKIGVPLVNGDVIVKDIALNDPDTEMSVNIVSYNKVQIPIGIDGVWVSIIYVGTPKPITEEDLDCPLPIPDQMIEALLNYIGYRGHGSVDGNINAESNTHYQRFEMSIRKIKQEGMFTSEVVDMPTRIEDRGFV